MPNPLPDNVKALLAQPNVNVINRVELVREYWNSDLRMIVDVTEDVLKYGKLTNVSTIKSVDWTVPSFTVCMKNEELAPEGPLNHKYSPNFQGSIWKATFQRKPRECALILRIQLPMPDGTNYDLHRYIGSIEDCIIRLSDDMCVADLVTKHMSHRPLSAKLTKASGDETVLLGGTW